MGLKSKEIEHLLIRQLKLTANEPATKHILFMTDGLCSNKLKSFLIGTLADYYLLDIVFISQKFS